MGNTEMSQNSELYLAPEMGEATPRILLVDDDPGMRRLVSAAVQRAGYSCETAGSIAEARDRMDSGAFDILFLDLSLPGGSGFSLMEPSSEVPMKPIVVIISGNKDLDTAVRIIREGAYDFIPKPFALDEFTQRLQKVVEEWRARLRYQYYHDHLEKLVVKSSEELRKTTEQIERIYDMAVRALGAALDLRDPETETHCQRVSDNSVLLGREIGLDAAMLQQLRWGAYLHDVGKIGIPESILNKPTSLTREEMEIVKTHPVLGFNMVSKIEFLKNAAEVILYHHERYDGNGYPCHIGDQEIPLSARIFAVVDAFDALIFGRPYRRACSYQRVVQVIRKDSGSHFDPSVVEVFLNIPEQAWNVTQSRETNHSSECIVDAV